MLSACGPAAPVPPPPGADSAGDPLPPWAIARIGTARFCGPSAGCAFSADGKSVIAACDDGFVRTFDVATGRETASFEAHRDVVKPEREGTLSRLDATFSSLGPPPDGIHHAAFSKDGTRLVTGGGPAIRIWEVATGKMLAELVRAGESGAVAFAPDGQSVRVVDGVRLWSWDPATESLLETPVQFAHSGFLGILPTRDAAIVRPVGTVPSTSGVVLADVSTGQQIAIELPYVVAGSGASPDGSRIALVGMPASGERTSPLVVCDSVSGEVLVSATLEQGAWGPIAWSPDGNSIAHCTANGVCVTDLRTITTDCPVHQHIRILGSGGASYSADGSRILVSTWTGPRLLDVAAGVEVLGPRTRVRGWGVGWTEDGQRVASPLEDGRIAVFDAATGVQVSVTGEPGVFPLAYVLDPASGASLVAKDAVPSEVPGVPFVAHSAVARKGGPRVFARRWQDGTVAIRDLGSGREIRRNASKSQSITLAASGRWLSTVHQSGSVVLTDVDADSDVATWTLPDPGAGGACDVAASVPRIVVAAGRRIFVFQVGHASPIRRFEFEARWDATTVAISRDGRFVAASVGWDVVVWDVDEDEEVVRLSGHRAPPSDLEFSPDGTRLVSASADGTALVWALPPRSR